MIAECTNSDNGTTDEVLNDCTWYDLHKDECGDHDTDEFHAYSMCCACQGKSDNIHITNLLLYNSFLLIIITFSSLYSIS